MNQDAAEHQLQGLLGGAVEVNHRVKIAVPHTHEVPHGNGGDDGGADGEQNLKEVHHLGGTVDVCRLLEVAGDSLVISTGDNHVPDTEGPGDQNGQRVIQPADIADQQVGGDQAAAKEHGDDKDDIEEPSPAEIRAGHGVGRQKRNRAGQDGSFNGIEQSVFKAHPNLGVGHNTLIGCQGPLAEVKGHSLVLEGDGINEGRKDDIYHRENNGNHKYA